MRLVATQSLLAVASLLGAACYDWDEHAPVLGPVAAGEAPPDGEGGASNDPAPSPDPEPSDPQTAASTTAGSGGSTSASSSSVTSGVGVGGGGPTGACDLGVNCDDCIACAVAGACEAQADACAQDLECIAFSDCISGCADEACLAECDAIYPDGSLIFQDAAVCVVCGECSGSCADLGGLLGCI